MGHIELAAPVSHIWYFKGIPSRRGVILDLSPRTLEKDVYKRQGESGEAAPAEEAPVEEAPAAEEAPAE